MQSTESFYPCPPCTGVSIPQLSKAVGSSLMAACWWLWCGSKMEKDAGFEPVPCLNFLFIVSVPVSLPALPKPQPSSAKTVLHVQGVLGALSSLLRPGYTKRLLMGSMPGTSWMGWRSWLSVLQTNCEREQQKQRLACLPAFRHASSM